MNAEATPRTLTPIADRMERAGLSYEFDHPHQFYSVLVAVGIHTQPVVAFTDDARVFVGYYSPAKAQAVADRVQRMRGVTAVRVVTP